mmetsp:Transcript_18282/g.43971  ORF Transcript_18282/g.43971 Transcript_18282/m.43971 type:complete len:264 (-) Transcript_18282:50-841(-)
MLPQLPAKDVAASLSRIRRPFSLATRTCHRPSAPTGTGTSSAARRHLLHQAASVGRASQAPPTSRRTRTPPLRPKPPAAVTLAASPSPRKLRLRVVALTARPRRPSPPTTLLPRSNARPSLVPSLLRRRPKRTPSWTTTTMRRSPHARRPNWLLPPATGWGCVAPRQQRTWATATRTSTRTRSTTTAPTPMRWPTTTSPPCSRSGRRTRRTSPTWAPGSGLGSSPPGTTTRGPSSSASAHRRSRCRTARAWRSTRPPRPSARS